MRIVGLMIEGGRMARMGRRVVRSSLLVKIAKDIGEF
jgi:hypothetical protein